MFSRARARPTARLGAHRASDRALSRPRRPRLPLLLLLRRQLLLRHLIERDRPLIVLGATRRALPFRIVFTRQFHQLMPTPRADLIPARTRPEPSIRRVQLVATQRTQFHRLRPARVVRDVRGRHATSRASLGRHLPPPRALVDASVVDRPSPRRGRLRSRAIRANAAIRARVDARLGGASTSRPHPRVVPSPGRRLPLARASLPSARPRRGLGRENIEWVGVSSRERLHCVNRRRGGARRRIRVSYIIAFRGNRRRRRRTRGMGRRRRGGRFRPRRRRSGGFRNAAGPGDRISGLAPPCRRRR